MSRIADNLSAIRHEIISACSRANRNLTSVELIAVSKTFPIESIVEAFELGHLHFGENKLQEAELKISALPDWIHWHFIGRVQSNKVRKLLHRFEVIHGIDSLRLAAYVDQIAGELGLLPQIFLQVNLGNEISKGGFIPELLPSEMESVLRLKHLKILGLMCLPPAGPSPESARPWFAALREMRDKLEMDYGIKLPSLSMGMSDDFQVAIEEGATHVRVGSAIFGNREPNILRVAPTKENL